MNAQPEFQDRDSGVGNRVQDDAAVAKGVNRFRDRPDWPGGKLGETAGHECELPNNLAVRPLISAPGVAGVIYHQRFEQRPG